MIYLLAADAAQSFARRIDYTWPFPAWASVLFFAAVMFAVGWAYRHETGTAKPWLRGLLAASRVTVMAIVLWMIAGFVLIVQQTDLPLVAVLVDRSASMATIDRYDDASVRAAIDRRIKAANLSDATRFNQAREIITADEARWWEALSESYRLRLFYLAEGAASVDESTPLESLRAIQPDGEASRLGAGVRSVLDQLGGQPVAALVLLSDGITTDGPTLSEVAPFARRKGVPLFTVGLGTQQAPRDVELRDLVVEDVVFVDDVVQFEARLSARGFRGRTVQLILKDGKSQSELARQSVEINSDTFSDTVRVGYRPKQVDPSQTFTLVAVPHPDETTAENNSLSRTIAVRQQKLRVLLVQSEPSFEFRYLKHLLERHPTVELAAVLQEADVEFPQIDKTALGSLPVGVDALAKHDVIVLMDVNPALLSPSALADIRTAVRERAVGLAMIAGPRFNPTAFRDTPLAELLPIQLDGVGRPPIETTADRAVRVTPTELGRAQPALMLGDSSEENRRVWERLTPIYWSMTIDKVKRAAEVLAEHPTDLTPDGRRIPLIVSQPVGAGLSLFHGFDGTYLWRGVDGGRAYSRYWLQTLRGLARPKLLGQDRRIELTTDRREYRRGQPVWVQVRFFAERDVPAESDGVRVVISSAGVSRAGSTPRETTLARRGTNRALFAASLDDLTDGEYEIRLVAPSVADRPPAATFVVRPAPGELARLELDADELANAARISGGRTYTFENASRLPEDLPTGRAVPVNEQPPLPLWNHPFVPALLLSLLVGEWLIRKRCGMA